MKLLSPKLTRSLRMSAFRAAALVLALMASLQVLPVELSRVGPPEGEQTPVLSLEPLNICDGGLEVAGFLVDHPWVPASCAVAPVNGFGAALVMGIESFLPDGVRPPIFHPPRSRVT